MIKEHMTSRQRIKAVMEGKEPDRFPVWLKMLNNNWRNMQPEPYKSMPNLELQKKAGCDPMDGIWITVHTTAPHIEKTVETEGLIRKTEIKTPDGDLAGKEKYDPTTSSFHPVAFMANSVENLKKLKWAFLDTEYTVDKDAAEKAKKTKQEYVKKDVYTRTGVGPGPLMNMIEHLCGPVDTVYLMNDEKELFEEILDIMHKDRMRYLKAVLPHTAADTFWLTENTSTTLISPQIFKDHCMDNLRDYGNLILENGIIPVHHMCGTLNALLEMIDTLPAKANEAFTTRPLGDVSLAEGRKRMASKTLIGGTNATLWLEPVEKIVETVENDLSKCPDRRKIFLTSAGVLPPPVDFEKAKRVVHEFKQLKAG